MRCNHCGKDFGDGLKCQHCGIDRVEGLGSFNGFNPDTMGSSPLSSGGTTPGGISVTDSKNMLCYSCGEIIPDDSVFCPICRTRLYVTCPKCGRSYSSQYDNCNQCGTNRQDYLDKLEQEKQIKFREEAERQKIEALKRKEEQERQRREEAARRRREDEAREQKERQEAQKRQLVLMAIDSENKWIERFISNNTKLLSRYYKTQRTKKTLCTTAVYIIVTFIVVAMFLSIRFLGSDFYERGLFGIFSGFFLAFLNGAIGFEAIKFTNENKAILRYVQNAFYDENGRPLRYTNSWVIITTCIQYGVCMEVPSSPESLYLRKSYDQQTDAEVDINWTKPFVVTAILGICFSLFFVWPYPPMPKGSISYSGSAIVTMGDPLSNSTKKQNVPISKVILNFDARKGIIIYSAYSLELTIKRMYREGAEIHVLIEERDLKNPVKGSKLGEGISAVYEGIIPRYRYGTFSGSGKNWKGQFFSFKLEPV